MAVGNGTPIQPVDRGADQAGRYFGLWRQVEDAHQAALAEVARLKQKQAGGAAFAHWPGKHVGKNSKCGVCGQDTEYSCSVCTVPLCPAPCLKRWHDASAELHSAAQIF